MSVHEVAEFPGHPGRDPLPVAPQGRRTGHRAGDLLDRDCTAAAAPHQVGAHSVDAPLQRAGKAIVTIHARLPTNRTRCSA